MAKARGLKNSAPARGPVILKISLKGKFQSISEKSEVSMGGIGSGRIGGDGRKKIEECHTLDVNTLNKAELLSPGTFRILSWTIQGRVLGQISLTSAAGEVELAYQYKGPGNFPEDIRERIAITRQPCPFGGSRPYFLCPGLRVDGRCGRRSVKLYRAGKYFLCRKCHCLAYSSQNEGNWDRVLRRCQKVRKRLGGHPGLADPFPKKPKGMWESTYQRVALPAQRREELLLKCLSQNQRAVLRHIR